LGSKGWNLETAKAVIKNRYENRVKIIITLPDSIAVERVDKALISNLPISVLQKVTPGGIDLNAANLNLQIKRDGRGVPLPLNQQDMAQLNNIEGFVPEIIEIKPAINVPIINELQQKLQSSLPAMANPA